MQQKVQKFLVLIAILLINTLLVVIFLGKASEINSAQVLAEEEMPKNFLEIYTIEDYLEFAESVSAGKDYMGYTVFLRADLDFAGYDTVPTIGDEEGNSFFFGTFDGDGHQILNLRMKNSGGNAGVFAYLAGTVKNLIIKDCEFSGKIAGAVSANSHDANILNCYIDAEVEGETAGTIVGNLKGNIYNCVAKTDQFIGSLQSGNIEYCYKDGTQDYKALNDNLSWISGYAGSIAFYAWDESGEQIYTSDYADVLASLTAKLEIDGRSVDIKAYYSNVDRTWGITLPSTYYNAELTLSAKTSHGGFEQFYRVQSEDEMIFEWDNRYYLIRFVNGDGVDSFFVTLEGQKSLKYVHDNKDAENEGLLMIVNADGTVDYEKVKAFGGRGNDSWSAPKKGYKLKFSDPVDLMGMGKSDNFALLAGYRSDSLMNYVTTTELIREVGFEYAPQFRLVSLYVAGEYVGIYFLAEKVEFSENRINLPSIYEETKQLNYNFLEQLEIQHWKDSDSLAERYYYNLENNPEDITGNYLLEKDVMDFLPEESRFVTTRGVPMVMARAMYSSKEQVEYIADYWQEFEDALFAENGINDQGKHFTEYIDLESFAMQWLTYELVQEVSMASSIYYYKESEISGDGLLHACFPWDMEYSYAWSDKIESIWNITEKAGIASGYWEILYQHQEFKDEVYRVWNEKFIPAIDMMISEEATITEDGTKNLRWYEENLEVIHRLENNRWANRKPLNKCISNRSFLEVRKQALSILLEQ